MSKAFTTEQDNAPEEELQDAPLLLLEGAKNYMTAAGAEASQTELKSLMDLPTSERGPSVERRIRFLQTRMALVEVVDASKQDPGRVFFGARVTLQNLAGESRSYQVVGIDEADPKSGRISWISPIARKLLNAELGDEVSLRSSAGDEEYEIVAIKYPG